MGRPSASGDTAASRTRPVDFGPPNAGLPGLPAVPSQKGHVWPDRHCRNTNILLRFRHAFSVLILEDHAPLVGDVVVSRVGADQE